MNSIKKTDFDDENKFEEFLDKIELIYIDNQYTSDVEEEEKYEKIAFDMIDAGEAFAMCRGAVDNDYIKDAFYDEDMMGYIAKINGEYAGFVLFKKEEYIDQDCDDFDLYLSLIGTLPKLGMPLGQILISVVEEVAKECNCEAIYADAIQAALPFYKKNDWDIIKEGDEDDTYFIEKKIKKDELVTVDDSDYELDFGHFNNFEAFLNNITYDDTSDEEDNPSYFQKVLDYTYSWF